MTIGLGLLLINGTLMKEILHDLDAAIYLDSDVIVVSPIEEFWSKFVSMNSSQIAGLAPEHEDERVGWYNQMNNVPHVGHLGTAKLLSLSKTSASLTITSIQSKTFWKWNNLKFFFIVIETKD